MPYAMFIAFGKQLITKENYMIGTLVRLNTMANIYGSWEYEVAEIVEHLGEMPAGDAALKDLIFDITGMDTLDMTLKNVGDLVLLCLNHKPLYAIELDVSNQSYKDFSWNHYDSVA